MLIRTHMQDLKDVTRETHYENYRAHCIQSMTRMVVKERNRKYAFTASVHGRRTDGWKLRPYRRILFVIKSAASRFIVDGCIYWLHSELLYDLCSKLTRESGTDFPIPALSGAADDTEKLIREKDEEVRHAERTADAQQPRRHQSEQAPDAPHEPEGLCYEKGDEYLWAHAKRPPRPHVFWG